MRIGLVDYLNAFPFRLDRLPHDYEVVYDMPSNLNRMMRNKELEIALCSSVEAFSGNYQVLEEYCIGAHHKILSVNFYTQRGVHDLDGARIGLHSASATSIELLKILAVHYWNVEPTFEVIDQPLPEYDGFLLIGNRALEAPTFAGYQTIDLAQEWYEMTQLPFVFALFLAQPEVSQEAIMAFEASMERALRSFKINDVLAHTSIYKEKLASYFALCHHRMGNKEREGLALFQDLREKYVLQTTA